MNIVIIILLVAAFICFLLAAFGVVTKRNLVALGLAAWVLAQLLPHLVRVSAVVLALCILTGCLAVTGTAGYTDPKTGATVGFTVGNQQPQFRNDAKRVVPIER